MQARAQTGFFTFLRRRLAAREAPPVLAEAWRGEMAESACRGDLVLADARGGILAKAGRPGALAYFRSSAKPFQVLPLLAGGAADFFGFSPAEIAVMAGSHAGEAGHLQAVREILSKAGLTPAFLRCGLPSAPGPQPAANLLAHNCSGKHAGMLALARYLGAPLETYEERFHPAQIQVAETLALVSGLPAGQLVWAVDGCGAPTAAMPLERLAVMAARLADPPEGFSPALRRACARVVEAMLAFPEMVGAGQGNFDTDLIRLGGGRLISKSGAEGVYMAALLKGPGRPTGLGLAFKLESGDASGRFRPVVALEALRQAGVFPAGLPAGLERYAARALLNARHDPVGRLQPGFDLGLA